MAIEQVRAYLKTYQAENRILEFDVSSATVALAARALGCEEARIAKTMAFSDGKNPVLVVTAGDMKLDNAKFKAMFHVKASMLTAEELPKRVGHAVGGVCPFAVKENVRIFLDRSLLRFDRIYPACGSANSAIAVSCEELEQYCRAAQWVDLCKESAAQKE